MVDTKHKSRADSGVRINAKVEFLLRKELNTKMVAHKENDCGSGCRSTQFELNGHGKMKLLLLNFNARRSDLSRSTTCVHSISTQYNDTQMLCSMID